MERFEFEEMLVSDWGLREGIVADLAGSISQTQQ
jgi:exopolyphosphatase/pppGpp-phosphohydrolase